MEFTCQELRSFDTNTKDYKDIVKLLKTNNLTETIRNKLDYSILLKSIENLELEHQWSSYYNLVRENCIDDIMYNYNLVKDKLDIDLKYIRKTLVFSCIYATFIGFATETETIKRLISDGYTIVDDDKLHTYVLKGKAYTGTYKEYLDSKYAIDLRVTTPDGILIGIQFKSISYLNLSFNANDKYGNSVKGTHHKKHTKAINGADASEVYFIFHHGESTELAHLIEDKPYFNYKKGDYLIKSHHVTTLNQFEKPYIKYTDFQQKKLTQTAI